GALGREGVTRRKYFQLLHRGVRFSHYVGVIQIGQLSIEVLPKADRDTRGNSDKWHTVLLDMLRECKLLKVETQGRAHLRLRSNHLLELYFELFLQELERLMRQGLLKSYRLHTGQLSVVKGRIDFQRQLTRALPDDTRFHTRYHRYEYDHLLNQVLQQALLVLSRVVQQAQLRSHINALLRRFPKVSNLNVEEVHFRKIIDQRKAKPYRRVLELARLILLNYSPDLKSGQHDMLAILFDMNLLFEEYVFRILQRSAPSGWRVSRQVQRPFWRRRSIRPDILVEHQQRRMVLDTKWKVLSSTRPGIDELKQMYVYCQYFRARHAVLLYPQVFELEDLPPTPWQSVDAEAAVDSYCQLLFLEILRDGKLHAGLAQDIWRKLQKNEDYLLR
ncbi:MAG: hypothetical protein AAFO94_16225, partial [Bacteroidota bacterium]